MAERNHQWDEKKICPCIVCGQPVEVTKFMAPAKVRCEAHASMRTETARTNNGSAGIIGPIILNEAMVAMQIEMAEEVESWNGDIASCPKDPMHDVAIKSVVGDKELGYVVTHQCQVCHTIISYSTQHKRELLPQGIKTLARNSGSGVEWRRSRLGYVPSLDCEDEELLGIILGRREPVRQEDEPNG